MIRKGTAWLCVAAAIVSIGGCGRGEGAACRVSELDDGGVALVCPDGSSAVISDGRDGGTCREIREADGTRTIACEDGTTGTVSPGEPGSAGDPGDGCHVAELEGLVVVTCADGSSASVTALPGGVLEGDFLVDDAIDALLLQGFSRVTGSLSIGRVTTLPPLMLTRVDGTLSIYESGLSSLRGLERLASAGSVRCEGNEMLTDLDGLSALAIVEGDVSIQYNHALTNLDGLSALARVGGRVSIQGNHALEALSGLEGLNAIEGSLEITNNSRLKSISRLQRLTTLGGPLTIRSNRDLPQCEVEALVERLRSAGWEGSASIQWNDPYATCP